MNLNLCAGINFYAQVPRRITWCTSMMSGVPGSCQVPEALVADVLIFERVHQSNKETLSFDHHFQANL